MIRGLGSDVRHAWRGLRRSGGFTVGATAVLALGTGTTVTMLTVVDGALLRDLPYPKPERLLVVEGIEFEHHPGYLDASDIVRTARSLERAAVYGTAAVNIGVGHLSVWRSGPCRPTSLP